MQERDRKRSAERSMAPIRRGGEYVWQTQPATEPPMSHLLDPESLRDEADYLAALDELEDLMLADPGTPGGRRFDELAELIEDFEARRDALTLRG